MKRGLGATFIDVEMKAFVLKPLILQEIRKDWKEKVRRLRRWSPSLKSGTAHITAGLEGGEDLWRVDRKSGV